MRAVIVWCSDPRCAYTVTILSGVCLARLPQTTQCDSSAGMMAVAVNLLCTLAFAGDVLSFCCCIRSSTRSRALVGCMQLLSMSSSGRLHLVSIDVSPYIHRSTTALGDTFTCLCFHMMYSVQSLSTKCVDECGCKLCCNRLPGKWLPA